MSLINDELRDFIEAARMGASDEELESAWVSAFRSFLSDVSRQSLAATRHRIKSRENAAIERMGEAWEEWELDLAFNPNYSYTEVARHLGRTPESVIAARKRHRKMRRDRLKELTDIMDGKYDEES